MFVTVVASNLDMEDVFVGGGVFDGPVLSANLTIEIVACPMLKKFSSSEFDIINSD